MLSKFVNKWCFGKYKIYIKFIPFRIEIRDMPGYVSFRLQMPTAQ